jgi:hypothetical protein
MDSTAVALRAVLKKEGSPDVLFELHRNKFDYTVVQDGRPSVMWWQLSPQQALSGASMGSVGLAETWQRCMARFPDYVVTEMEEASA